jgi:hypothetical protein
MSFMKTMNKRGPRIDPWGMERLVYKHSYNYLIDNNLITSHQSGFTPGDSALIISCTLQKNLVERWTKGRK